MERPPGQPTPCHKCPKIPEGEPPSPESALELTPQLRKVYAHYRRCKAVGRFPDDPLVDEHAAIVAEVEESIEAGRWKMVELGIKLLATAGGSRAE